MTEIEKELLHNWLDDFSIEEIYNMLIKSVVKCMAYEDYLEEYREHLDTSIRNFNALLEVHDDLVELSQQQSRLLKYFMRQEKEKSGGNYDY